MQSWLCRSTYRSLNEIPSRGHTNTVHGTALLLQPPTTLSKGTNFNVIVIISTEQTKNNKTTKGRQKVPTLPL